MEGTMGHVLIQHVLLSLLTFHLHKYSATYISDDL